MRRLGLALAMSCTLACTRDNPAFGDGEGTGGGTASDGSSSATTPAESSTGNAPGTTTKDPQTSGTEGATADTGVAETGEVAKCEDSLVAKRTIEVTRNGEPDHDLACPDALVTRGPVLESILGQVRHSLCETCECTGDEPEIRIKTEGVPLPKLPVGSCVEIIVERTPACELRGITISTADSHKALFVSATDTVDLAPNPAFPNGIHVPQADQVCTRDGCAEAGDYDLDFVDAIYGPSTMVQQVPLFGDPSSFDLTVLASSIDKNCARQIAWDAKFARL